MYSLLGFSENIKNVYRLAYPYRVKREPKTTYDLKKPYLDFLSSYHRRGYINKSPNKIISDQSLASLCSQAFSTSSLNDLDQEKIVGDLAFDSSEQVERANRIENALDQLRSLNREIFELFDLCIHSILVTACSKNKQGLKAHGGTSSGCIGLMWLPLTSKLQDQDVLELLIHELTHTLIFLDERNHRQFVYKNISKKSMWAQSAILNRRRPMDKVIHSIIVATEILLARRVFLSASDFEGAHPDNKTMIKNTLDAIQSVLSHKNLEQVCLPRSVELTKKCQSELLELESFYNGARNENLL